LLTPFSLLYYGITAVRNWLYNRTFLKVKKLTVPVISIGNITAGGTGKTPFAISLANRLTAQGFSPAIITRGYKRKTKKQVIVSKGNGPLISPRESGDEPWLMSQKTNGVVIIADRDRYQAGKKAVQYGCDVVIADDAFQHRRLHRNVNIVLWDAYSSPQKEKILPVGRLREGMNGLRRADLIVLTRTDRISDEQSAFFQNYGLKCYSAATRIGSVLQKGHSVPKENLARKKILAFCGLGNPEQFFDTVKQLQPLKLITARFQDHHKYTSLEMMQLMEKAAAEGCYFLMTTEKDLTNIPLEYAGNEKLLTLSIELKIDEQLLDEILKIKDKNYEQQR